MTETLKLVILWLRRHQIALKRAICAAPGVFLGTSTSFWVTFAWCGLILGSGYGEIGPQNSSRLPQASLLFGSAWTPLNIALEPVAHIRGVPCRARDTFGG